MFAYISALFFITLPMFAFSSPLVVRDSGCGGSSSGNCNTGPLQCCSSITATNSTQGQSILKGLNLPLDANGLIGLQCSPINVIGESSACEQNTYCCTDNSNGLISLGCTNVVL